MTEEEQTLKEIRDVIATIPEEAQVRVRAIAQTFRNALSADPGHAPLALALVGAELAAR